MRSKKKIDAELQLYFPSLFNDTKTKEYFDQLKRLTLAELERIADGDSEERKAKAEQIRESLILFTKPKVFMGTDGLEVRHDKEFETMCLMITKETARDAKKMSVLEYYNAYEYLTKKANESQKRQNKAR